jgi:hypothetical protein
MDTPSNEAAAAVLRPESPADELEPRMRGTGISVPEYKWIQRVVGGQGLVEACGSPSRTHQQATTRALRYLATPAVRERLIAELMLTGQPERAQAVLAHLATMVALEALGKGDARTALQLMPRGKSRPAPKRPAPAAGLVPRESEGV